MKQLISLIALGLALAVGGAHARANRRLQTGFDLAHQVRVCKVRAGHADHVNLALAHGVTSSCHVIDLCCMEDGQPSALAHHAGEVEVRGDGELVQLDQIPGYAARHGVRPGLTGLTQVYASRDISRTSKFRLDRVYLKRASFWLDLKLILLSFWITGRGDWEKRNRRVP